MELDGLGLGLGLDGLGLGLDGLGLVWMVWSHIVGGD